MGDFPSFDEAPGNVGSEDRVEGVVLAGRSGTLGLIRSLSEL